jgi:hypothetical protein
MPNKRSKEERTFLANSLVSWKTLHRVEEDPYVEGLIRDLNSGQNLDMWASINPLEYLPHPNMFSNARLQRVLFFVALVRNALVFSPVALTWLAISKATSAFSAYTTENSLTVVNFLDFWENGYGVLSKNWSLSRVATLDFQIIVLIISLTIGIGTFERRLKHKREVALDEVDRDRVQIALEISGYLFKQQKVTPQIFNASSAGILRNLASTSKSMEKSSKDLNKAVNSLPSHRDLLSEIKNIKSRLIRNSE